MSIADKEREEAQAEIRNDIVRRLFAVAVSVGFAARLGLMPWVQDGTYPSADEWRQIAALITALIATLLSWDGYLLSIRNKPLNRFARFAIDVILIFIYMFLLIASRHLAILLWTLVVIFSLYVIWDILTVRSFPKQYDKSLNNATRASFREVVDVYFNGALGKPGVSRGPVITVTWAIYFAALAILIYKMASSNAYVTCLFAFVGLVGYRLDKRLSQKASDTKSAMIRRVSCVVFFIVVATSYFYFWIKY